MLIITADDLGRSVEETDVVIECHGRGTITTASAMMFMSDSERAAALATQSGIPVGLHLNLTEAFTGEAPGWLESSHVRVRRFLRTSRYALLLYHPGLRQDFAKVVSGQLHEFRRLYRTEPNHVDGHQHMHLATNVILQGLLPGGVRVRRNFTFMPGQKGTLNRRYRAWVDRRLARRHPLTDQFYSLTQQMQGGGLEAMLRRALAADVELMVHPVWPNERELLMGDEFRRVLATESLRLSS